LSLGVGVVGVTDLTNYTCYLQVRHYTSNTVTSIEGVITTKNEDGDKFIRLLLPSETSTLSVGLYSVGFEITNTVTLESTEKVSVIEVTKQKVVVP
jgi:hypothetical protein